MHNLEVLLAVAFSLLTTLAGVGFVLFRQPVHAAISFAITVLSGTGLYLLLDAPYTAVATVIVYAGATIIIFLFALMFAQRSTLPAYDLKISNPLTSLMGAVAITAILAYTVCNYPGRAGEGLTGEGRTGEGRAMAAVDRQILNVAPSDPPRVADLGRVMYTQYLWTIELAGAILLIATLGAIQIAREDLAPAAPCEDSTP